MSKPASILLTASGIFLLAKPCIDQKNDPAETWNFWDKEECKDLKLDLYRILCDRMAQKWDQPVSRGLYRFFLNLDSDHKAGLIFS